MPSIYTKKLPPTTNFPSPRSKNTGMVNIPLVFDVPETSLTSSAVYTTTNKQLEDPTARRLENFWWHVWGSDRRFLHGHVLARLYEDISVGPTFVPLRGPPNRWEGPAVGLGSGLPRISHL